MMLPANKPRRDIGIKLPFPPREIKQICYSKHEADPNGEHWNIMTLGITMETMRSLIGMDRYPHPHTPEWIAYLQEWVNLLGPALYNPINWLYRSGRNNRIDGHHRYTVLEAMDFDFVYVYLVTGNIPNHAKELAEMKVNLMPATSTSIPIKYPWRKNGIEVNSVCKDV